VRDAPWRQGVTTKTTVWDGAMIPDAEIGTLMTLSLD
jgi:hypothetical protein